MNSNMNRHIKQAVEEHEYDVDPQEIWEGILAKQKSSNKRRYWFLLLPLMLSVATLSWIYLNEDVPRAEETTTHSASLLGLQEDKAKAPRNDDKALPKLTSAEVTTSPSDNDISTRESYEKNLDAVSDETSDRVSTLVNQSTTSTSPSQYTLTSDGIDFSRFSRQPAFAETTIDKAPSAAVSPAIDTPGSDPHTTLTGPLMLDQQPLELGLAHARPHAALGIGWAVPLSLIEPAQTQITRPWSVVVSGHYGRFTKSIVNSVDEQAQQLKLASEKAKDAFSANVMIQYDLPKNFFVRGYAGYRRAYEKLDWDGSYIEDVNGVRYRTDDQESIPEDLMGQENLLVERNASLYNQYNTVDVSLAAGYSMRLGRFTTSVFGGVGRSVYVNALGTTLDEQGLPAELDLIQGELSYQNRYLMGIDATYPLGAHLGLYFSGVYSRQHVGFHSFDFRYHNYDLGLGLRYAF